MNEPQTEPMTRVVVNGAARTVEADADMPLLWALRDVLGLKGTKYGCGVGVCGVCLVLIDGQPNHACMVPLRRVASRSVTTVEGLARSPQHRLLRAWVEEQVPQCGYCHPGQLVAAAALLDGNLAPSDEEIDSAMSPVLCRCGTYKRIRRAIRSAGGRPDDRRRRDVQPAVDIGIDREDGVPLNEWIRIRPDNSVVVTINHSEMGQGVLTSLAMLVAEELEVDLPQVRPVLAPAERKYTNPLLGAQVTGGSTAIRAEWAPLRRAGASARERLVRAAMRAFNAKRSECRAESGSVVHGPSGRRLAYAQLAAAAGLLGEPKRLALKDRTAFRIIGRSEPRLDIPGMVTGTAAYGIDLTVPDMVVATLCRSPAVGARVKGFDATRTMDTPGVYDVVALDQAVAVVAKDFWSASRGRERLAVEWEAEPHADLDTAALYRSLDEAAGQTGKVVRRRGAAMRALRRAERVVEARYRTPYLAHCTLEPMNCIAHVRADGCDIWVGTQNQTKTQATAAELTGLPKDRVKVHTALIGGGFGRRLAADFVEEAVQLSSKTGRPVQSVWTRQDDLQHDRYRPAQCTLLKAALDRDGKPSVWWQRIAGPPLALDMNDVPYAIPHCREEHVDVPSALPVGAWRGVGATQNAFVVESFIDELAHHAGRDPFEYRLGLLRGSRQHAEVLALAAERAEWGGPLPTGWGRGIAVYESFGSCVAQVAEISIEEGNAIRVNRVVCAIDCGQTVNPDTVRAQLEGGIAFGLSAALKEELKVAGGRIQQSGLDDYPILTHGEMPEVEVHIADSADPPGGVGEPGVPVIAPAVANAVFAAIGRRLRALPLRLA